MGFLFDAEEEQPLFGDEINPADMGPVEEGKKRPNDRRWNTPAKRAKFIATSVVFGDRIAHSQAIHDANVEEQTQRLDEMARRTERAIEKENYSRVKQVREEAARRHEMQMEMIRQQGALDRLNAIKAQQDSQPRGQLRMWNPKTRQWVYGNKFTVGRNGPSMT